MFVFILLQTLSRKTEMILRALSCYTNYIPKVSFPITGASEIKFLTVMHPIAGCSFVLRDLLMDMDVN